MDPEKFIELQKQMRENNEEVADFLKDFSSWKETVEAKNARLQTTTDNSTNLPAVRNSLLRKQKKKREKIEPITKTSTNRIKGYDYTAWDKFDVDKALEEMEDDAKVTDSASSQTDEELENSRRITLSKEARELGNLRFKEGNYVDAVEQYTTAVRLTPEDPVPLTNRAFAHLKLERYASAEADCSAALALDAQCVKALFRRALARKNLGKTTEAIGDLERVLQLDTGNKAAMKELSSLTGKPVDKLNRDSTQADSSTSTEQKHLDRGSRRFRRIPIVEVGGNLTNKPESLPKPNSDYTVQEQCKPVGDTAVKETVPTRFPDKPHKESPRIPVNHSDVSENSHPPSIQLSKTVPTNWFQLERDLRELSGRGKGTLSDAAVEYLCHISPIQYKDVIGNNLETGFLTRMLQALNKSTTLNPEEIASRLEHLSRLPRFDVAWMMVEDTDKEILNRLISLLEQNDAVPRAQLNLIRSQFSDF